MKGKVLVIDDDAPIQRMLVRQLQPYWDVLTASDAEQAEQRLAEYDDVRIVLCDQEMPGAKGLDFLRKLRAADHRATRVLITGFSSEQLLTEALNSRTLFAFLRKPFTDEELLSLLREAEADWAKRQAHAEREQEHEAFQEERARWRDRVARRIYGVFGVGGVVLFAALAVSLIGGVVGIIVLLLIYIFKYWLGIDFFPDRHLSDWFS